MSIKLKYNQNILVRLFNYCYISIRFSVPVIYLFEQRDNLIYRYNAWKDRRDGIESYEITGEMRGNSRAAKIKKVKELYQESLDEFKVK